MLCVSGVPLNWEAIGAIGEVVGAIAVIGTLAYLAIQIRHGRTDLKHQFWMTQEMADRELGLEQLKNPILLSAFNKITRKADGLNSTTRALQEYGDLTDEEAVATNTFLVVRYRLFAEQVRNRSLLTQEQIDLFDRRVAFTFSRPPGKIWFDAYEGRNPDDQTVGFIRGLVDSGTA